MKKVMLISSVLLTIIIGVYFYCRLDSDKYVLESRSSNQKVNTNALTMMYETEANSGEYVVSSDTSWPQEGYVLMPIYLVVKTVAHLLGMMKIKEY